MPVPPPNVPVRTYRYRFDYNVYVRSNRFVPYLRRKPCEDSQFSRNEKDMPISAAAVEALGQMIMRRSPTVSVGTSRRRFLSTFGVSSRVVRALWIILERQGTLPKLFTPTHLLWTLCFLKVYGTEAIIAALCGCDEKTLRKWVWICLQQLADIDFLVSGSSLLRAA